MLSRSALRRLVQPASLHWLSLAAAAVLLLWFNRHQWFAVDEWQWIIGRGVLDSYGPGLLEPHNEHWSTLPILVWRGLFSVFGVRTYTPYLLVLIAAHLAVAHLLWRLLLRVGVDALVATLATLPFLVLGAGWENLLQAFQFSVIVPLALGLGALLVVPDRGPTDSRDVLAIAILVVALMWSGVAVTMVVVVGVFVLLTRGVVTALTIVVPPAFVYLVWYAGWGRHAGGNPDPLTVAIQKLPEFLWEGLTATVDDVTGLVGIGAAVLALLGLFAVLRVRPHEPAGARVLAMAAGAVVFLMLTAVRRTSFGIESAGSARYVYIVAALLLPLAALAVDRVLRRSALRSTALVALTALVVLVQVTELKNRANDWAAIEQEQKHRILAAAEIAQEDNDLILSLTPAPAFAPDLTLFELARLAEDDKLPGNVEVTEADRLTALTYVQITLERDAIFPDEEPLPAVGSVRGATIEPAPDAGCVDVVPRSPQVRLQMRLGGPASIRIEPGTSGAITMTLRDGQASGRTRRLTVGGGIPGWLNVNVTDLSLDLTLESTGLTTLCRIDVRSI